MGSNPVFPNILYNNYFAYTINLININTSRKTLFYLIKYSTKIFTFVKLLKKINYIISYKLIQKKIKNKNILYLKLTNFYYKNLLSLKQFKLIYRKTRIYYVSLNTLKLLAKRSGSSIYLISTSGGLFTHLEAIDKKLSGLIIGFLFN